MICKKCKKDVPDGRYCIACGADQSASKKTRPRTRPNGTGTAYKRGSTWTAQVTVGIKRDPDTGRVQQVRRTKGGFKTKREALEFCQQLANAAMPKKHVTFGDLWEQYEKTKFRQLSASKQCGYRTALKRLGDMIYTRIDAVTIADLQGLVDGLTFYCARDIKVILRHMYKIALVQGWAERDLAAFITLPPRNEKERTPFTDEEICAIWRGYDAGDTWAGYILLMIYTGMMPGELIYCRKDMVHLDSHQIIGAGLKTNERKEKPIVIADFLMPVVQALMDYAGDSPMLCGTCAGKKRSVLQGILRLHRKMRMPKAYAVLMPSYYGYSLRCRRKDSPKCHPAHHAPRDDNDNPKIYPPRRVCRAGCHKHVKPQPKQPGELIYSTCA